MAMTCPRLKKVLRDIGVPKARPFMPDPFQLESLKKLKRGDVLVSAPTGSGKTWIAVQAMKRLLEKGGRAWYASPLKALSNAKYEEFGIAFGRENVGILTGDRKENSMAPIIVGTTEILRNQLYDAMYQGEDLATDLVVIDEAHYLGDPERGVVWEEVIIYLPHRVKILLLSATVSNAEQIASWLEFVRGKPCLTVIAESRPVPLYPIFFFPKGEVAPLSDSKGLWPKVRHFVEKSPPRRFKEKGPTQPIRRILDVMEELNLLPAIFFLKSRADCDNALIRCYPSSDHWPPEKQKRFNETLSQFLHKYPFIRNHAYLHHVRKAKVASHHAGHLLHWKLLVEMLMQEGLLDAIFSTSTVAAGVNFPARTVVIVQSDRFNGHRFVDLTATDLLQMTGRAGRRGMDRIGFVMIVPGPYQDVHLIHSLLNSPPEPVKSQIYISFSMVLNLLLSYGLEEIRELLGMSFGTFQKIGMAEKIQSRFFFQKLTKELSGSNCSSVEEAIVRTERRVALEREIKTLSDSQPKLYDELFRESYLTRGRLFLDKRGHSYCVIGGVKGGRRTGVVAAKVNDVLKLKRGKIRLKRVSLDRVKTLLDVMLKLPDDDKPKQVAACIEAAANREFPTLDKNLPLREREKKRFEAIQEKIAMLTNELSRLPCESCINLNRCFKGGRGGIRDYLWQTAKVLDKIKTEKGRLWLSFMRHLKFLEAEGFALPDGSLLPDGIWASKLRLDQPLMIAEAIRKNALPTKNPALLAALIAPFVAEKESESDFRMTGSPPVLQKGFLNLRGILNPFRERQKRYGFATPPMEFWPAATIYAWGSGEVWEEVVRLSGLDEGDLAMLIYRTADNLRQLVGLKETHPMLSNTAGDAIELLLREPVVVPT